ncbi:MAG: PAS domain S-box protein [Bacteroidales bacterium]
MSVPANFEHIRQRISDKLLLVATIVSIPAAIFSGYRIFLMGPRLLFFADVSISLVLLVTYLARHKINYRLRLVPLVVYIFLIGIIGLGTFGLFGLGTLILFFIIIIVTTLFGMQYGLITLGLSAITFLIFTLLIHFRWISYGFDFNELNYSSYQWISRAVFFLCFSAMAVIALGMVYTNFGRLYENLAFSEARLALALESVDEVVWEFDIKKDSSFVSSKHPLILPFAHSNFFKGYADWKGQIHPDDAEEVHRNIQEHINGHTQNFNIEYRMLNVKDEWQWILTKGKVVARDKDGAPTRVLGTHTDIGPRKEMERSVLASEKKYRSLFMSANDTILLVEKGVITDCNMVAYGFFGAQEGSLTGRNLVDFCPPCQSNGHSSADMLEEFFREDTNDKERITEWEFVRSDGSVIDSLMSLNLIRDGSRFIYQAILHDISDRIRFEKTKIDAIVETEEKERQRLARDLHDDVGPLLSSLNMYMSLLNREQTENKGEIIENMQGILKDAIRNVREISNNLAPYTLTNYGLLPAINNFIEIERKLLEIKLEENIGTLRLPRNIELTCYRIIKELLNNTLKYARAKSVLIKLTFGDNTLSLSYADDGQGFSMDNTPNNKISGMGLQNIRNRLTSLNATCVIESKPGEGFHLQSLIRL